MRHMFRRIKMKEIYLDHAATTYMDKEVLEEMLPYFTENYGNPSSFHSKGLEAKEALDEARLRIAKILNCIPQEIIFTSGGTESDNLAIFGIVKANKHKGNHIITTKIEHHAVIDACKALEKEGFEITYLDVDRDGIVRIDDFKNAIKPNTILATIMYANNEIGTIQPIEEIGKICRERKIFFHTDACQAAGSQNLDVNKLNVDLMT